MIFIAELEGYFIAGQFYVKEICCIPLIHSYNNKCIHQMIDIPVQPYNSRDRATCNYLLNKHHGIPLKTLYDVSHTPTLPKGAIIITHGDEKMKILREIYQQCTVTSMLENIPFKSLMETARLTGQKCPIMNHGPHCAYMKCKILQLLIMFFITL